MFKHLLLPTDGSPVSDAGLLKGMQLAKSLNAKVTALHVIQPFQVFTYDTDMVEDTRAEYDRHANIRARRYLDSAESMAREAGVPCTTMQITGEHPFEAITAAAESQGCDLIAMASHGRSGLKALLIGSEAQKVLVTSKIPVLIFH